MGRIGCFIKLITCLTLSTCCFIQQKCLSENSQTRFQTGLKILICCVWYKPRTRIVKLQTTRACLKARHPTRAGYACCFIQQKCLSEKTFISSFSDRHLPFLYFFPLYPNASNNNPGKFTVIGGSSGCKGRSVRVYVSGCSGGKTSASCRRARRQWSKRK